MEMPTFDLVGHDVGGMVSWLVASQHAERVRSLTVVSTPHPDALREAVENGDPVQVAQERNVALFRRPGRPEGLLLGRDGAGDGLRRLFAAGGVDPRQVEEYVAALSSPGAITAALNWYRAMEPDDLVGLPPVVVPTLYIWGTEDAALRRRAAEATAERVAGRYRFVAMEGVTHWVPETMPGELSRLLLDHLAST
jgi:pimeloyl-ACP methyl ester carboxylesterase